MNEIEVLLTKCAAMISDAHRREVPLEQWNARSHQVLPEIYAMLEKLEDERKAACLTS